MSIRSSLDGCSQGHGCIGCPTARAAELEANLRHHHWPVQSRILTAWVRTLKSTVGGSMNPCAAIGYLIWPSHICAVVSTASLDAAA
jgi:hypothetical protein